MTARMVRSSHNEQNRQMEGGMLGNSTKMALINILQSLETGDPSVWDDQNESGKYCLLELHQMSAPSYRGSQADKSNAEPAREKLKRAIPHVNSMLRAIRRKDQSAALESGKLALAEM
jgi:hypothetical protein